MRHLELDLSCISFARPLYRAPLPFPAPAPWQHNPGAVPHSTPGAGPSQHPLHNLQEARLPVGHVREHVPTPKADRDRRDKHVGARRAAVAGWHHVRAQNWQRMKPNDMTCTLSQKTDQRVPASVTPYTNEAVARSGEAMSRSCLAGPTRNVEAPARRRTADLYRPRRSLGCRGRQQRWSISPWTGRGRETDLQQIAKSVLEGKGRRVAKQKGAERIEGGEGDDGAEREAKN